MIKNELLKRNLPDVLTDCSGKTISSKEEWDKVQRPYWKNLLLQEEYGVIPSLLVPQITKEEFYIDFGGKAVWENITFHFEKDGKSHSIPTKLIYPRGVRNVPFCICLDFFNEAPSPYLPVEELIDSGIGVFTVSYQAVTNDKDDFSDGLAGLFANGERAGNATGKIMYWSYMASRMMDYLLTREEADKSRIGVSGHSRLGKTALLTAALDERFAFCIVNESGCSGAALSRGMMNGAERIRDIYQKFPYWFCPNYAKYVDKEETLPFDQHCLMALVAPREVYVGGAMEDVWADNNNQFLSCVAASPVWDIYGAKGLVAAGKMPIEGESFAEGEIKFHLRAGTHFLNADDWKKYSVYIKSKI